MGKGNAVIGAGITLLAGIAAVIYFMTRAKIEPELPSYEVYDIAKTKAAEVGGIVGVRGYCENMFYGSPTMIDHCISAEHAKMLAHIANRDYSQCVTAYKRSHEIPEDGWDRQPYTFCSEAITHIEKKRHSDPVIEAIVEQAVEIAVTPTDVVQGKKIHPGAYEWIIAHTECKTAKDRHYADYQKGWVDARLQGYAESHSKFEEKVYEFAGMKKISRIWTPFRARGLGGSWTW